MPDPMPTTPPASKTPVVDPDAALLSGGPAGDHGKEMPAHGTPHPDLNTKAPNQTPPLQSKYEVNGKTFNSAAEMSQYVADLEKKALSTNPIQPKTPVAVPQELIDGRPVDEVLWENPTKVLNHFKQQVKTEISLEKQQEGNRKTFWNGFYKDHPDLDGKQDLVEAYVAKNWGTWQSLKIDDFSKAVAGETRSALKRMGLDKAVEVPNNNSAALSSSGETQSGPQEIRQPTSFIDELKVRSMRRHKVK